MFSTGRAFASPMADLLEGLRFVTLAGFSLLCTGFSVRVSAESSPPRAAEDAPSAGGASATGVELQDGEAAERLDTLVDFLGSLRDIPSGSPGAAMLASVILENDGGCCESKFLLWFAESNRSVFYAWTESALRCTSQASPARTRRGGQDRCDFFFKFQKCAFAEAGVSLPGSLCHP